MPVEQPSGLDARLIERAEDIPSTPNPGNYVIIDVLHFSNTVIELLANGAAHVHVTEERGDEFAYRESNPETKIGGGSTDTYDPEEGYDFFNSPSYVQRLDVEGVPAALWSSNGGRALIALRDRAGPDVDIFVGSTRNARALGRTLRRSEKPTYLVSAGSRGQKATEDLIGATLISRYLDDIPPSQTELELFKQQVKTAKGPDYVDKDPIRRRDVLEYAMDFNARSVVPSLSGTDLVPRRVEQRHPRAASQAAD